MNSNGDSFGEVNQLQALRECYPGATYFHLAERYEVAAWHANAFESFIRVKRGIPGRSTRPRIRTWINAGIAPAEILENHIIRSENGFLVECQMQITERVEGYTDGRTNQFHSYQELQQRNPNMRARSRNFRTSGVVFCVEHDWFRGTVKQAFADRLREVFVREYSIAPQDIGSAASNIAIRNSDGGGLKDRCIAIYDETYGSLRLTERLYLHFVRILDRLWRGLGDDEDDLRTVTSQLRDEISRFAELTVGSTAQEPSEVAPAPTGSILVFTKGSRVCFQAGQMAVEVEIIQPTMMNGELMYQVAIPQKPGQQPPKQWKPASRIEPSAISSDWNYAWWNCETETYEEPTEGTQS